MTRGTSKKGPQQKQKTPWPRVQSLGFGEFEFGCFAEFMASGLVGAGLKFRVKFRALGLWGFRV